MLNTASLYRLPFGQIFVRGISTAALGALQGMFNALVDYSKTRVTRAGGRSAENPFVQLLCAETAAAIDEMKSVLHRNFGNLHAYVKCGQTPPLDKRLQYKFQSTAVTERCTLLAARIFKVMGATGFWEDLPFGGILADLMAGRQHISNQYEFVGSSWGGVMFGLENKGPDDLAESTRTSSCSFSFSELSRSAASHVNSHAVSVHGGFNTGNGFEQVVSILFQLCECLCYLVPMDAHRCIVEEVGLPDDGGTALVGGDQKRKDRIGKRLVRVYFRHEPSSAGPARCAAS